MYKSDGTQIAIRFSLKHSHYDLILAARQPVMCS